MPDLTRTDVTQALRAVLAERTPPDVAVASGAKQVEAVFQGTVRRAARRGERRALMLQIGAYLIIADQIVAVESGRYHWPQWTVNVTFALVGLAVLLSIALTIRDLLPPVPRVLDDGR